MNVFDIFIAYVTWDGGGKMRPLLIIEQQKTVLFAFNITTQYENKSESVRSNYFKILDWQQAGLDKPSYVDTNVVRNLPLVVLNNKSAIGRLTEADIKRFIQFLSSER